MLLYHNRSLLRILLTRFGSIFYRTDSMICGLFLAGVSVFLQIIINENVAWQPELPHHYAMHALGVIIAFACVFRTNIAWGRYWESVTQLHFMYSKWADAYTQCFAFAQVTVELTLTKGGADAGAKVERVRAGLRSLERHFALLSALAADRLFRGDTQRMERRSQVAPWSKQVVLRRDLRGEDLTGARSMPILIEHTESRPDINKRPLGGSIIDMKEFLPGEDRQFKYLVKEIPTDKEREALEKSSDRVNMVMYWVVHGLARISKDIDIAPPIQSRMYQELSNGMLGFNNALKVADVPFPFPYAQLLSITLIIFSLFIPVYIVCFTKSMIVSPIFSFFLFQGIWGVNEVAKELENPFGTDANDISLIDFHTRFIDVLDEVDLGSAVTVSRSEEDYIQSSRSVFAGKGSITMMIESSLETKKCSGVSSVTSIPEAPPTPAAPAAPTPVVPPPAPALPPDGQAMLGIKPSTLPPLASTPQGDKIDAKLKVEPTKRTSSREKGDPGDVYALTSAADQHIAEMCETMRLQLSRIAKDLAIMKSSAESPVSLLATISADGKQTTI